MTHHLVVHITVRRTDPQQQKGARSSWCHHALDPSLSLPQDLSWHSHSTATGSEAPAVTPSLGTPIVTPGGYNDVLGDTLARGGGGPYCYTLEG
ncbi:hypothetical protein Hamer_G022033 [Homarus americanus]|uniref:Uncharacterized protein n=1 Tax=Homarus americanus TaxID=6706 RepID=A0A8J5T4F4_HOMAM|nr:hypothetical protein Hamer_G022033 [Homarus americanus]